MRNVPYLLYSLKKYLLRQGLACPSCGMKGGSLVDRKYIVTSLCRCKNCNLLYRMPTTSEEENERIYQRVYKEGFTTTMPSDDVLKALLASHFRGGEKDYSRYVEVLRSLGLKSGDRLFDFGCSWGYGSWQLAKAGFAVDAYEISKPRANFAAEKLGVNIVDSSKIEPGVYDVFFSSHVIEHVPSVNNLICLGMKALRPGGLFVAFTPNACSEYRRINPKGFHSCWGFVHPQLIDWEFLLNLDIFKALLADSSPYSYSKLQDFGWNEKSFIKLNGPELVFAIKKLA
jgi:2-polyprenyl-3-methyl-5-hydroxy-6-metoxy-1,4-benzoquinol methylase